MKLFCIETTRQAQENDPDCPRFIFAGDENMDNICGRFAAVMDSVVEHRVFPDTRLHINEHPIEQDTVVMPEVGLAWFRD